MTRASLNSRHGIPLPYANRHGLITGQTGTGKSVSLMRLAEQFSHAGVLVFVSDVKGDLAALSRSCPVQNLDLFAGLSVTVSAMGADLMARALELSDVQAGCLEIAYAYAADIAAPLETLADLRIVLSSIEGNADIAANYGRVSAASVGVVMRAILRLEGQGGKQFFRAPCFDVARLVETEGLVSILDSTRLINSPRVYSAFMLWLLTELWERLPEIGDIEKPRLIFFFDEAHLLFQDCPAALLRRIEQTTRLIRSKGVGLYFVSQRPEDIPEIVRSQLAHCLQHDRALPVGSARFQSMDSSGRPTIPAVVKIDLPTCPLGALRPDELPETGKPATESPAAICGQYDAAGYAFLAVAGLTLTALVSLAIWVYVSGQLASAIAIAFGILFALRPKG